MIIGTLIVIAIGIAVFLYVFAHAYAGKKIFASKGRSELLGFIIGMLLAITPGISLFISVIALILMHFFLPNKNNEKLKNVGYGAYQGDQGVGGYAVPQPSIRGKSSYDPPTVKPPSIGSRGTDSKSRKKEAELLYKEGLIDKAEYNRMRSSIR